MLLFVATVAATAQEPPASRERARANFARPITISHGAEILDAVGILRALLENVSRNGSISAEKVPGAPGRLKNINAG